MIKTPLIISISDIDPKSGFALHLAVALGERERQVCLLRIGPEAKEAPRAALLSPEKPLEDFIRGNCSWDDVRLSGPGRLWICRADSLGDLPSNEEEYQRTHNLLNHLHQVDYLILSAGTRPTGLTLKCLEAADLSVLVVIPEAAALQSAFPLLKSYKKTRLAGPMNLVIREVKSEKQAEMVFKKFQEAVGQAIKLNLNYRGAVAADPDMIGPESQKGNFIRTAPDSSAAAGFFRLADHILSISADEEKDRLEILFPVPKPSEEEELLSPLPLSFEELSFAEFLNIDFAGDIVRLLVKEGHVTPDKVIYAQKIREKLDTPKRLLEMLQDMGYVREEQVKETLFKNRTGIRLGSLLVELGYISDKQLNIALNKQKQSDGKVRLGEILVESRYVSEYDLVQILSISLGLPYVEPDSSKLDSALMDSNSRKVYLSHHFIPMRQEDGSLIVAIADPLNANTMNVISKVLGPNITPAITMPRYISQAIDAYDSVEKARAKAVEVSQSKALDIIDNIIKTAVEKGVSDIHIEAMKNRSRVRYRLDGSLVHFMDIPRDVEPALINRLKVIAGANITEKRRHQDGRIVIEASKFGSEIDMRVSFYISFFGETVVMRLLSKKTELLKVDDLGMGPKILDRFKEEVLDLPTGVIMITGPTGAGKTTTLYGAINYKNRIDTKIITAEDPVEYVIEGVSQCGVNPKLGVTFEETLRHMLRQDPDVIVLGEIRDKFTAESAIKAALTGHKVMTTFHTEDSIGALLRLMNMDIEPFLISSTVVGVVAQRLIKKVCPYCVEPYIPSPRDIRKLKYQMDDLGASKFVMGSGCERCDFIGYKGRVGIFELLIVNEPVREAIIARAPASEIRRVSLETTGMVTLAEDGLAKAAKGITSLQEVIRSLPILEPPRSIEQIYRLTGETQ